ncbi:hypothetical protein [Brevibacterium luteolum]|uniref:Uncharacterized protein n=1 Tax=Brevibacterium luteolum TaxID=199591 RepID=A0A6G8KYA0_9MICO|nr:hypothetical protein [Brevibacterium luteolum]MBU8579513.1 hypothetical protein [Brevibacterium luteolum]QIN29626.1 hypothetical protein EW640_10300 [Brevibacterium luteolum]
MSHVPILTPRPGLPTRKTRLPALALAASIAVLGTACSAPSHSSGSSAAAGADQQAASESARALSEKIADSERTGLTSPPGGRVQPG